MHFDVAAGAGIPGASAGSDCGRGCVVPVVAVVRIVADEGRSAGRTGLVRTGWVRRGLAVEPVGRLKVGVASGRLVLVAS
jgi:hypothetical protein